MSAVLTPNNRATQWRAASLALGLVWLTLGGLYADTVRAMVGIWNGSETFAHAFLVPPIALWLIWRQRTVLARLPVLPQPLVLVGMAAFAGLWLLADLVQVNAATQFAWMAMLVLAVPAVLGFEVAWAILFPLLFLFFAVPMGEFLREPMMNWTADFTVGALRLSGVPVYREGNQFVIPSGSWSVVEACAGVRYLIASLMVGALFAYLNFQSYRRRALFMLVAILVPVVANWLRAYMIVMLGHLSNNTIAVGVDHLIYGWVFFGVVVMAMFFIGARWSEPDPTTADVQAAHARMLQRSGGFKSIPASYVALIALAVAGVMLAPRLALLGLQRMEGVAAAPQLNLPDQLAAGWRVVPADTDFRPEIVNPNVRAWRSYAGMGGTVTIDLAYYRGQAADRKLVTSVNTLVRPESKAWNQAVTGTTTLVLADKSMTLRTAHLLGMNQKTARRPQLSAWRIYWIDGHWVAGDIEAKLTGAVTRLQGRGDEGALLVLWTDNESRADAQTLLQKFARDNLNILDSLLARTRDMR